MKKSKKFILAVLVILVVAIGFILANPDWISNNKEEVVIEVSDEVQETSEELGDEIFD